MPSVTRLTDMNEYENASKPDQPLTNPVAFLRNSDGAAVPFEAKVPSSFPVFPTSPGEAGVQPKAAREHESEPTPRCVSERAERPTNGWTSDAPGLAVDQQIALHRSLLRVEVDDGSLEDAVLVRAARVDRQRRTELHGPLAFMDVAVERKRWAIGEDRLADRL